MSRDMFRTGEELDLGRLTRTWDALMERWKVVLQVQDDRRPTILSARAFDESQTSGNRAYNAATRYLHCAVDNHRALVALLLQHGATPWAPWNLLRPCFEASFYAVWVLEPPHGLDRRKRGLRLEVRDNIERTRYWHEVGKVSGYGAEIRQAVANREATVGKLYRDEAHTLGATWKQISESVNVLDEIYKLQALKLDRTNESAVLAAATWRSLSGIQHGYGYAILQSSDIKAKVPVPGGQMVTTVISDEEFQTAALVTAWLMLSAMDLYIRRCTRHD